MTSFETFQLLSVISFCLTIVLGGLVTINYYIKKQASKNNTGVHSMYGTEFFFSGTVYTISPDPMPFEHSKYAIVSKDGNGHPIWSGYVIINKEGGYNDDV